MKRGTKLKSQNFKFQLSGFVLEKKVEKLEKVQNHGQNDMTMSYITYQPVRNDILTMSSLLHVQGADTSFFHFFLRLKKK
jgi:hypothetical protein